MHINRGLLFWGVALITAGVVALAASQGWIDTSILAGAWRLWPVVLIAIGLSIVLARTPFAWLGGLGAGVIVGLAGGALIAGVPASVAGCSGTPGSSETANGSFTGQQASVTLELTCGNLTTSMVDGATWRADTAVSSGDQPSLGGGTNSLEIRSHDNGLPFGHDREAWTVELGREVAYDLSATLNAADAHIDGTGGTFAGINLTTNAGSTDLLLDGAQVADLQLQLNAGSANVVADADSDLAGSLQTNAGSINLCVANGTGVQITVNSSVAFSHNLAERGLQQQGNDTWVTPSFASAAHRIVLDVEGNAASFNLNPEDGCS